MSQTTDTSYESVLSPQTRARPTLALFGQLGLDPSSLRGMRIIRISRSSIHPAIALHCDGGTVLRILVDGYDPEHGVPKSLVTDAFLEPLFQPPGGKMEVDLVIKDCALITMSDKGLEKQGEDGKELIWDQRHSALAFKLAGDPREPNPRWHCVWSMLHEEKDGVCRFRSYADVYVTDEMPRSPSKSPRKDRHRGSLDEMPQSPSKSPHRDRHRGSPKKRNTLDLDSSPTKEKGPDVVVPPSHRAKLQKSPTKVRFGSWFPETNNGPPPLRFRTRSSTATDVLDTSPLTPRQLSFAASMANESPKASSEDWRKSTGRRRTSSNVSPTLSPRHSQTDLRKPGWK